jgi:hypothetical protein
MQVTINIEKKYEYFACFTLRIKMPFFSFKLLHDKRVMRFSILVFFHQTIPTYSRDKAVSFGFEFAEIFDSEIVSDIFYAENFLSEDKL